MNVFPTTLDDQPVWLDPELLTTDAKVMLQFLHDTGYGVQIGITEEDAAKLSIISLQPSIRNYCPKDHTERFKNLEATQKWLVKGRATFLLKERNTNDIAGYSWSGPGTNEHVPEGTLTGALRLNEQHQGKGLARPFLAVVLDYTTKNYPNEVVWFETWASNVGAVHIYEKLGFTIVDSSASTRKTDVGNTVEDTRLFMKLR